MTNNNMTKNSIEKENIQDILNLSGLQAGILFHYLMNPEDSTYVNQLSVDFEGAFNEKMFLETWEEIFRVNGVLRSFFRWEGIAKPLQIILKKVTMNYTYVDLREIPYEVQQEKLKTKMAEDYDKKFDLSQEVFRVTVYQFSETSFRLMLTNHHILYDGWSTGILLKEFVMGYNDLLEGRSFKLMNKMGYKEFEVARNGQLSKLSFWQNYLSGFEAQQPMLHLIGNQGKAADVYEQISWRLSVEESQEIRNLLKRERCSLATLIYTVWGIILQRYSHTDDVIFGTTVSGRNMDIQGIQETVGLFINTLPVRFSANGNVEVRSVLKDLQTHLIDRNDFEGVSLVDILESIEGKVQGEAFDTLVVVENYPIERGLINQSKLEISSYNMKEHTHYPLVISLFDENEIRLSIQYSNQFDEASIQTIKKAIESLLSKFVESETIKVNQCAIISDSDSKILFHLFNQTEKAYPHHSCIHELFFEQACQYPNAVGIRFEDQMLTYKEIAYKAKEQMMIFKSQGVQKDCVVAIVMERSPDLICNIFALFALGAIYLPIDVEVPRERLSFILKDSGSKFIFIDHCLHRIDDEKWTVIEALDSRINLENFDDKGLNVIESNQTGYIIYTSGSTGIPKGVAITHQALINFAFGIKEMIFPSEVHSVMAIANYTFDISILELVVPLIFGREIILSNQKACKDINIFVESLENQKIDFLQLTPSRFLAMLDVKEKPEWLSTVRKLVLCGEPFPYYALNKIYESGFIGTLYNMYGPTETTIWSTYEEISADKSESIGRPLANTQIYILDKHMQSLPLGLMGEICIAGDGLAKGYINRDDLTREKFIIESRTEKRIYRTGDIGRWYPDGRIELLGRADDQVKIRGHRIELGEIDAIAGRHPMIDRVVTIVHEELDGGKSLCCYFTTSEEGLEVAEIKRYMAQHLPEYMIPGYLIHIESMPLTINGKINRKNLPKPDGVGCSKGVYTAPRSRMEEALSKVWCEVLGLERVSVTDNFFDIGGHSLKATLLTGKISKSMDYKVSLRQVFENPTVEQMSILLEGLKENPYAHIEAIGTANGSYPMSSAQQRIYSLQQMDLLSTSYNMPIILKVEGQLDQLKLAHTIEQLIHRHESLRTSFNLDDEQGLVQVVHERATCLIEKLKSSESFVRPFDLSRAPLLRVGIYESLDGKQNLLFDMHHIISDGGSMTLLVEEFTAIYGGRNLEPLRIQYKDYSQWQSNRLEKGAFKAQESYWLKQFDEGIPILELPLDYARPAIQSYEGSRFDISVNRELGEALRMLCKETGTTYFMLMFACVGVWLTKYTTQEDFVIGTPVSGRPHVELDQIMGMFVNTLAIRVKPEGKKLLSNYLSEVKESILCGLENGEYPFEQLVENLSVNRDFSRNPVFDVMFSLQSSQGKGIVVDGLKLSAESVENLISKFDLNITVFEKADEDVISIEYCTKLFNSRTIERMADGFLNILQNVVSKQEVAICEIDGLSSFEKNRLLEFNEAIFSMPVPKAWLHDQFEDQCRRTPNKAAVLYQNEMMTYSDLNEKSTIIAQFLKKSHGTNGFIGIIADRSIEMIIGILGILKSGNAYVPIDPEYPEERKNFILTDCEAKALLVHTKTQVVHQTLPSPIYRINTIKAFSIDRDQDDNIDNHERNELAYMIYTSGSTGAPKGVKVPHRTIMNTLKWRNKLYGFNESDVILQLPSFAFDSSVEDIFCTLLSGGTLLMIDTYDRFNSAFISSLIFKHGVTHFLAVPNYYDVLLDELAIASERTSIRSITIAGESFTSELIKKHYDILPEVKLYNEYGPTECSVCATAKLLERDDTAVKIGKSIDGVVCYVLDAYQKIVPIGVIGELYISGLGVSNGYHNRAELTAEKFLDNPYHPLFKMYRTGDLVKWDDCGQLEFVGRIDSQVKVNGYRIELGEIEALFHKNEKIIQSAVVYKTTQKQLAAYLVIHSDTSLSEIKTWAKTVMPNYMIPSTWVKLEQLPLSANGKIDRTALVNQEVKEDVATEDCGAQNLLEQTLHSIFTDVLNLKQMGFNDNFFEKGGSSLKAITLVNKINKRIGCHIGVRMIFECLSIRSLAEAINKEEINKYDQIKPINNPLSVYPMSSAQQRLYSLQQMDLGSTSYNMPIVLKVDGELNRSKLEQTIKELIQRHEAFRTSFKFDDSQGLVQVIHETAHCHIETSENSSSFIRPFDLTSAPLLRMGVCHLSDDSQYLMFDMHHIISDGESMRVLVEEFARLYNGEALEPLRIQYKDYSEWQRERMEEDVFKSQGAYWHQQFEDEIPVLSLPTDYSRPALQSHEGSRVSIALNKEISGGLQKICQETGTTYFMLMLAGVSVWLSKYTGQEDLVIGTPVAGRPHADLERIMGMFVNTLAIRIKPEGGKSFKAYLSEVRESVLGSLENGEYPFERLVEELPVARDFSRNPLFDVMFSMPGIDVEAYKLNGLTLSGMSVENLVSKFDLNIKVIEGAEGDCISIDYCTKLFKKETMDSLIQGLAIFLENISQNLDQPLSKISTMTAEEKRLIVETFNHTGREYPVQLTLNQRFEVQAKETPARIAVMDVHKHWTYEELSRKSDAVAAELIRNGIAEGDVVAVMMDKTCELMGCLYGVLKNGSIYLPIDRTLPWERIQYMLVDSKAKAVIVDKEIFENFSEIGINIYSAAELCLDNIYKEKEAGKQLKNQGILPAYIIYTSGSTGQPKGVVVSHESTMNLVHALNEQLFSANEQPIKIGMLSPIHFDASIKQMFPALSFGHTLVLISDEIKLEYKQLALELKEKGVEILDGTPSLLGGFIESDAYDTTQLSIKHFVIGGETLKPQLLKAIKEQYGEADAPKVTNVYGPTECTDISTMETIDLNHFVDNWMSSLSIGKPIANVRTYILDQYQNIQPIGVAGELHISGAGLAIGYLNQPELTKERFVDHPYESGKKMYRTGDLCRWLSDGRIEFLGRADHQVKIRGYRIELSEIDALAGQHPEISSAVTLIYEEVDGDKNLCCYYTALTENLEASDLRSHLSKHLPDYMVPGYLVRLEQMPLTANGKINRKALPRPNEIARSNNNYIAPRSRMEELLSAVWCDLLGIERLSVTDNFFEIGGHSLKATALIGKISKTLGYSISLRQVFENATLEQMALVIERSQLKPFDQIEAITSLTGTYSMSSAQQRLYSLQQMDLGSTGYNMPMVLKVEGQVDPGKLENAINALMDRHEAFRTTFNLDDSQGLVQRVHEVAQCVIEKHNTPETFIRPFDLETAPLLRVGICESSDINQYLMFDMHHIISDGGSMAVLVEEFVQLYNGKTLEPLRIQYKDYSEWQSVRMKNDILKSQGAYWHQQFEDEIPVLNLPIDYPRPALQSHEGSRVCMALTQETSQGLQKICQETGTTYFMLMLAGVSVWLSKYTGQEDLVIGTPVAGRPHADLERIIGMFVNTLAIRTKPEGCKSFKTYLSEVRESVLGSLENGEYPFERLVEELPVARDFSRNPLFDVMFSMQNASNQSFQLDDVTLQGVGAENHISKFDMSIIVLEGSDSDHIVIEYCTKLFKRETIEQMATGLITLLENMVLENEKNLLEYSVLTPDDYQLIKEGFNQTNRPYPKDRLVYSLFEEQVLRTPEASAMSFNGETYTYREMGNRYETLKQAFTQQGVGQNSIMAVSMKRCPDLACSILAIFGLGGIYMPIDTEVPEERLKFMLQDSGAQFLVSNVSEEGLEALVQETVMCKRVNSHLKSQNTQEVLQNKPESACYLLYTSGSTGQPKGVLISNQALANFAWAMKDFLGSDPTSIVALTANTFDISMTELVVPLLFGHEIKLANPVQAKDIQALSKYMNETTPKVIQMTPSRFIGLISFTDDLMWLKSAEKIMLAGEPFPYAVMPSLREEGFRGQIYNLYGPTETTVYSTFDEVLPDQTESIGRPVANTQIYILDKHLQMVPKGVVGEICIGGEGLAIGYLNRPDLTAEKFVNHPYEVNQKIYRTGDLGRWLADGRIEFFGRADHQVKIRGFRIELGEIDNQLSEHAEITAAVTMVNEETQGDKILCCYYTTSAESLDGSDLRLYLSKRLPDYMVPGYFVRLEEMPLTANGKINRKALPKFEEISQLKNNFIAPRSRIEESLCAIWRDLLRLERISVTDNFFEIGGHSLKATALTGKISKALGYSISLRQVFENSTVEQMAKLLENTRENTYAQIEAITINTGMYPMSSAQKRLYSLHQMDLGSTSYNMPMVLRVEGQVNQEKLEHAINELIKRHEALRTSFGLDDSQGLVQFVHETAQCIVEKHENLVTFIRPFDLETAPLLRVGMCVMSESVQLETITTEINQYLMFDMHHIISDGASMSVLVEEFAQFYNGEILEPLRIQYKDYSEWHRERMVEDSFKSQGAYWQQQFEDEIPVLSLPTDYPRPALQSHEGNCVSVALNQEMSEGLRKICQEAGTTYFMLMFAGVSVWLSKFTGQEDLVIGTPVAGRPHADLERIMGMFVNTLAIRTKPEGGKSFKTYLSEVRESVLGSLENGEYPFERLVEELPVVRDFSRNPLFDVMFSMQNDERQRVKMDGVELSGVSTENPIAKFDLGIVISEKKQGDSINLEYCTKLFKKETVEDLLEGLVNLLGEIASKSEVLIKDLMVLDRTRLDKILIDFNTTQSNFEQPENLYEWFEQETQLNPQTPAIRIGEQVVTYMQLSERCLLAEKILRENQVHSQVVVGVRMTRSVDLVCVIMALFKMGATYLPLEPGLPEDRIKYMLADSAAVALVTNLNDFDCSTIGANRIQISDLSDEKLEYQPVETVLARMPEAPKSAYIIYTSGSTGQPKGVEIGHSSVINLAYAYKQDFFGNEKYRFLALASCGFDISVIELVVTLMLGHEILLVSDEASKDLLMLASLLEENVAEIVQMTPSKLFALLDASEAHTWIASVKKLILGGEDFPYGELDRLYEIGFNGDVYNAYGPTETTVCATMEKVEKGQLKSIGKPLANTQIYILDKYLEPVPMGVKGEICIGGDGLALGYVNQKELTTEKFVNNPYNLDQKIYRTGDLGRWYSDGRIEFLGRVDHQVKIRGNRIELGEITSQLESISAISRAVIKVVKGANGYDSLCAYFTANAGTSVELSDLKNQLKNNLPDYMIPNYMMQLESFQLTKNGKIDEQQLPEPEWAKNKATYQTPSTETEKRLAHIWQSHLKLEDISVHESFFDLGGNSLLAVKVIDAIQKSFQTSVSFKAFMQYATIETFAQWIERAVVEEIKAIGPVEPNDHYPVASAQLRLWIQQQLNPKSTQYNMPSVVEIEGNLDKARFYEACHTLIMRHESLRTKYALLNDEVVQIILTEEEVGNEEAYILCSKVCEADLERAINECIRPFALDQGPLLRCHILELSEERHIVVFDTHHIASDGFSNQILIGDFFRLYDAQELPELKLQYKDYASWHKTLMTSPSIKASEVYWMERLKNIVPTRIVSANRNTSNNHFITDSKGASSSAELDNENTKMMKEKCKALGVTPFAFSMAVFNLVLSKYSNQKTIVIGTPYHGRSVNDLFSVVGVFLNVMLMKSDIDENQSFEQYVKAFQKSLIAHQNHQEYPIEEIHKNLVEQGEFEGKELYHIMFNYLPVEESYTTARFKIKPYGGSTNVEAKCDMTLYMREGDQIAINCVYKENLYEQWLMDGFVGDYVTLLKTAANADIELKACLNEQNSECLQEEWQELYDDEEII